MSKIKVNEIEAQSGSTITVPTGQNLVVTDGLATSSLPTVPVSKGGTGLTSLGTANQELRVNSGATALEFYTPTVATSDYVKLASGTFSSSSDNVVVDGFVSSTYKHYIVRGMFTSTGNSGNVMRMRLRNGSTDLTAEYLRMGDYRTTTSSGSTSFSGGANGAYNQDHWVIGHNGSTTDDGSYFEIILNDLNDTTYYKNYFARLIGRDGSSNWVFWNVAGMYRPNTNAVTGFKLYTASGSNWSNGNYQLYGIK
jgi:hypothetical protein